jgi:hypothetical protein
MKCRKKHTNKPVNYNHYLQGNSSLPCSVVKFRLLNLWGLRAIVLVTSSGYHSTAEPYGLESHDFSQGSLPLYKLPTMVHESRLLVM